MEITGSNHEILQCLPLKEVVLETHIEHSNERSLQQPHQHVAPVVLVIRDSGVTHIHRKGHQEELDGGPEKSGPLSHQSRLHIKLEEEIGWKKRSRGCRIMGWVDRRENRQERDWGKRVGLCRDSSLSSKG